MKLIVGLGNPGPEYENTRHNAGFMALDRLALRHRLRDAAPIRERFHSASLEGTLAGHRCLLLRPVTFMNRSGMAVGEAMRFYKLERADLMVIVDDLALATGRIRLRGGGSPGGHNGLLDIRRALGDDDYPRLRIGIDAPGRIPQVPYVLGKFRPDQLERLDPTLDAACDAIECWLRHGLEKAMTQFNSWGLSTSGESGDAKVDRQKS